MITILNNSQTSKKTFLRNIIFMIGDGMGVSYTSAYRYMKNQDPFEQVKRTSFDPYLVGQQMTYPNDPFLNITDSAAAATALATGVKTYNGAISVNRELKKLRTILEAAKENGKLTGIIATSEITHATPAAFGSHNTDRNNMNEIANSYFDERMNGKHKIDLLLGGGEEFFVRKDRDLSKEFMNDGYSYITNRSELLKNKNHKLLGLFAKREIPKMIDRPKNIPSLEEMAHTAIQCLNQHSNGFFLFIEGSQIDWGGHNHDIVSVMSEITDFEKAFNCAINFARTDEHTLVIATADHSTGGFTIGANGHYYWNSETIGAFKRTPGYLANELLLGANLNDILLKYTDCLFTSDEVKNIEEAIQTYKPEKIENAFKTIIDKRTNTIWTTDGHTGEDVPIYAYGPYKENFAGLLDNTDIAKCLFEIIERKQVILAH
ncbi:alkaline phosphatase 3 [Heyndrickxia sporothermodurans]|nr:alkaline phosphatase 3 [Heyndrickxia sporothermodurans]